MPDFVMFAQQASHTARCLLLQNSSEQTDSNLEPSEIDLGIKFPSMQGIDGLVPAYLDSRSTLPASSSGSTTMWGGAKHAVLFEYEII